MASLQESLSIFEGDDDLEDDTGWALGVWVNTYKFWYYGESKWVWECEMELYVNHCRLKSCYLMQIL